MYDASVEGVQALIRHVRIEDSDEPGEVTPSMVEDWLIGFGAHVALQLGSIEGLPNESMMTSAARRIVERYVAGDVLDAAYPAKGGRNEASLGKVLRDEALAELEKLVIKVGEVRSVNAQRAGDASWRFPKARVKDGMRF